MGDVMGGRGLVGSFLLSHVTTPRDQCVIEPLLFQNL